MSARPPQQHRTLRKTSEAARRPIASIAKRWEQLHDEASQLARLAGLAAEVPTVEKTALAAALSDASDWQRDLAWQGIEDIDAMMQPGLTALKTITSRGQDASAPALALWREFHAARESVLSVIRLRTPSEPQIAV